MAVPIRQCCVCRKHGDKNSFFRIVRLPKGKVVFDEKGDLNGRGAYICMTAECIRDAKERDRLGNSLKSAVSLSVYRQVADAFKKRRSSDLETLLGFAVRSGKVVLGATAIQNAAQRGGICLILVGKQAGVQTQKRLERISRTGKIPSITVKSSRDFDLLVGKPNCVCAGITDASFAETIGKTVHA
jgi:predicted RNA-binding protein YlxR (DUF448 family)